jgi:hypothetical protein
VLYCRLSGSLFAGVLALGVVQQVMADNDTLNALNVQPAIAISVGDWNLITRTIAPLV